MAHVYANRQYSSAILDAVKAIGGLTIKQAELEKAPDEAKPALKREVEELEKKVKSNDKDLDFSLQTGLEIYSASLANLWAEYQEPTETVESFLMKYEQDLQKKERDECKHGPIFDVGLAQKGLVSTKKTNPTDTEKYDITVSEPLKYTGEITMDILEQEVLAHSTLSDSLDWSQTLKELLLFGRRVGLDRAQIAKAIKVMTKAALPHYFHCIERVENAKSVWDSASTFVDLYANKRKIRKALDDVVRRPGDDLAITLNIITTLVSESLRLESPDIDDDNLKKLSRRHAMRSIEGLVERGCWEQLNIYKTDRWKRLNKPTSMEEVIRFVNEVEATRPEFALQSPRRIKPTHIDVNINHISLDDGPGIMEPVDLNNYGSHDMAELHMNTPEPGAARPFGESQPFSRGASRYGGSQENLRTVGVTQVPQYETRSKDGPGGYTVKSDFAWAAQGAKDPPPKKREASRTGAKTPWSPAAPTSASPGQHETSKGSYRPYSPGRRPDSPYRKTDSQYKRADSPHRSSDNYRRRSDSPGYGHQSDRRDDHRPDRRDDHRSDRRDEHRSEGRHDGRGDRRDERRDRRYSSRGGSSDRRGRRGSKSPYRSSSRGYSSRPSRGRSKSPFSGRQRLLVRTNSGNYRSLSRSRLMVRKPDGTVTNRQLSRSPSSGRITRCKICHRQHRGQCNLKSEASHKVALRDSTIHPLPIYHMEYGGYDQEN